MRKKKWSLQRKLEFLAAFYEWEKVPDHKRIGRLLKGINAELDTDGKYVWVTFKDFSNRALGVKGVDAGILFAEDHQGCFFRGWVSKYCDFPLTCNARSKTHLLEILKEKRYSSPHWCNTIEEAWPALDEGDLAASLLLVYNFFIAGSDDGDREDY